MGLKVWTGDLQKIVAVMRRGPPRVEVFRARVVVGDDIHVSESTANAGLPEEQWSTVDRSRVWTDSLFRALVNAPLGKGAK